MKKLMFAALGLISLAAIACCDLPCCAGSACC